LATRWKPDTKLPRGQPRQKCRDRIAKDLSLLGIENGEKVATERRRWKYLVVAAMDLNSSKAKKKKKKKKIIYYSQ